MGQRGIEVDKRDPAALSPKMARGDVTMDEPRMKLGQCRKRLYAESAVVPCGNRVIDALYPLHDEERNAAPFSNLDKRGHDARRLLHARPKERRLASVRVGCNISPVGALHLERKEPVGVTLPAHDEHMPRPTGARVLNDAPPVNHVAYVHAASAS
jgi:hypothetical protein